MIDMKFTIHDWMIHDLRDLDNNKISGNDLLVFAYLYEVKQNATDSKQYVALTDICTALDVTRQSISRNISYLYDNKLISRRKQGKSYTYSVSNTIDSKHSVDTPSNGALFDVSKPKKQSIISLRNEIKGKIEDFVMHRCENDQELLRLLLEYLRIVGTSKKSLVPSVWDKKLEELDGHSKSVADKIASVNNALSATPVYSRFYPVKKQAQTNGTPVFDPRPFGKYDVVTEADLGDDFIV